MVKSTCDSCGGLLNDARYLNWADRVSRDMLQCPLKVWCGKRTEKSSVISSLVPLRRRGQAGLPYRQRGRPPGSYRRRGYRPGTHRDRDWQYCRQRGGWMACLQVREDNPERVINLYEKLGFVEKRQPDDLAKPTWSRRQRLMTLVQVSHHDIPMTGPYRKSGYRRYILKKLPGTFH
jgi:hypothetical protein